MEEDAPLVSFKKALVTAMEIVEDMDFPLPLYELFHLALKIPFNSETHTNPSKMKDFPDFGVLTCTMWGQGT